MSWLSDSLDDQYDAYDDDSFGARPNPKANRPRTKQRPEHKDAVIGMVSTVDRGRYTVALAESKTSDGKNLVSATRGSTLRKKTIVPGDRVAVVGDISGEPGSLARIVRIEPRKTLLRRSADDTDQVERIVVANADQLLIVVAAADPTPRPRLVDRYLVAAFDAGIEPILLITKTDLCDPAEFIAEFDCLDLTILTGSKANLPMAELYRILADKITVAVGHSGVGKSTLVNQLVPGANRETGQVNDVTGRGRHTSSSSLALRLPSASGWLIDTPGVRSFGLGHVNPENVILSFAAHAKSIKTPSGEVPLGAAHDWEIIDRVRAGELGESGKKRIESLTSILENLG